MEKAKKSKKKLIAIIAGAAMAFVLTVAVSVGATLAYFGDKVTGNANQLTMQGAVDLGNAVTLTASTTNPILPGASVKAAGEVTVASTTGTPTDFVVALQFTAVSSANEAGIEALQNTSIGNFKVDGAGTYYLVKGTDTYANTYYVVATDGASSLAVITGKADAQKLTFDITTQLNTALTNSSALSTIDFTATVIAIQAFGIDKANPNAPTIAGAQATIAAQAQWSAA